MLTLIATLCSCAVMTLAPGQHPDGTAAALGYTTFENNAPTSILLTQYVGESPTASWVTVWVVAHELGHYNLATTNEDRANCYALANFGRVAVTLGASRARVRMLWRDVPDSWVAWRAATC